VGSQWLLVEREVFGIAVPLLGLVVFWLCVLFMSFGLFAPRNATVTVVLFLSTQKNYNNKLLNFYFNQDPPTSRTQHLTIARGIHQTGCQAPAEDRQSQLRTWADPNLSQFIRSPTCGSASRLFFVDFKPGLRNFVAWVYEKSAVKLRDFETVRP
jgi:hypothetical protein